MTQTEITIEACVARGVALLDEKMPGWRSRICLEELELDDCNRCVLGQLYGYYQEGLDALGIHFDRFHYGFSLSLQQERYMSWEKLAQAWKDAIAAGKEKCMSVEERVACGIDLLDKKTPDWFTQVDLEHFNMEDNGVLEQIYGDYIDGLEQIGLNTQKLNDESYGFDILWEKAFSQEERKQRWQELTDAWKAAITARRGQL